MKNRVSNVEDAVKIENVLLSVSDKSNLSEIINGLLAVNPNVKFYSTGGTYTKIKEILGENSDNLKAVSDYTGQPEMQGGLVKTLDFKIYLGLLSESYNDAHKEDLKRTGAIAFDMVVVNLYPFKETISREGATLEDGRANIDIGGPCMLRASAKNYLRVASVCNPDDYKSIVETLKKSSGSLSLQDRFHLAKKSFKHTAEYDAAISEYLLHCDDGDALSIYSTK